MKIAVLAIFWIICILPVRAEMLTGTDATAQLPFWEWRDEAMKIRFVQRLPDQTRAYFAGRGFAKSEVDDIAGFCIFQTVYTNISTAKRPHVITHDIHDWRYHYRGITYKMTPRENWRKIWQRKHVAQPQIVAFEWSLLPSKQVFQSGDYNWGMSVFALPPGASFNLDLAWKEDGKPQSASIKGITCAKDVYIAP